MGGPAEAVAVVGLIMSVASAGYSVYSSDKAADEAEDIAKKNASIADKETEETLRRAKKEAEREIGMARALAAASGVEGETTEFYIDELQRTRKDELDWIRSAGSSRSRQIKQGGQYTASGMRSEGYASAFGQLGKSMDYSLDWYNTFEGK